MKISKKIGAIALSLCLLIPTGNVNAATGYGSGGRSTIDYMSSAKLITWSVRPDTNWPYEFFGSIIFGGNASGSVSLWEQGFGYEGGEVSAKGKGYCTATLTGTAYALNGNAYVVMPGVSTAYYQY